LVAAVAAALGAFLTLGAGNALAFSCTAIDEGGGVFDVVLTMNNETVTLAKGNLSQITANGVPCGATTSNTETIFVNATGTASPGPADNLVIDEGGGRFEPGDPFDTGVDEIPGSLNEIEFVLFDGDLDGLYLNTLTILGNAAPDTINIGEGLAGQDADDSIGLPAPVADPEADEVGIVNLNGDDDADVYLAEPDTLSGAFPLANAVVVRGRGGNDVLTGKGGDGTGTSALLGLVLDGGDGDDSIQGGEASDTLIGGAGNDVLDGDQNGGTGWTQILSNGAYSFACNNGDIVDYSGSTGPITADLDPGELHPGSATGDGTDVIQNVEAIVGSPGNDTLSGDNGINQLYGGAGDDTLAGDAGDFDCVVGGDGNDTIDENEGTSTAQGGSGTDNGTRDLIFGSNPIDQNGDGFFEHFSDTGLDDTITYSARTTRINVFLEQLGGAFTGLTDGADLDGDGTSNDDEGDMVGHDVENVITGSGNDLIVAALVNNRADNEFTANAGNDLMDGGAGNDTFHEGAAANGADDMDGGTGSDLCDYSLRTNPVSVNLDGADNDGEAGEGDNCGGVVDFFFSVQNGIGRATQGGGPGGGSEGDPIAGQDVENVAGGSGNDNLTGSDEANVLSGNAGNDTLTGNGGTDVLNGGDGDDWMIPGAGNDTAAGGAGTDTVDYASAGAGGVGVNVNLATGQASGEGNDTISDTENASGSSFADSIRGNTGANVLNARGGNDAVQGSDGDDTINGGAGADVLNGNGANDRVTGGTGQDTIRGGGGNDNLNGGPAADTIYGGAGNDVLAGGAGPDDHRGGPGSDRCNPGAPGLGRGDTATGCES
jgi:Ca2+-binding RTX toxin-like protein